MWLIYSVSIVLLYLNRVHSGRRVMRESKQGNRRKQMNVRGMTIKELTSPRLRSFKETEICPEVWRDEKEAKVIIGE